MSARTVGVKVLLKSCLRTPVAKEAIRWWNEREKLFHESRDSRRGEGEGITSHLCWVRIFGQGL
jgi:hypothetical protein